MARCHKYTPQIRAKAVRLVREHRDEYDTEWAAMKAISARLGMNVETLRKWLRQDEDAAITEILAGYYEPKTHFSCCWTPGSPARSRWSISA